MSPTDRSPQDLSRALRIVCWGGALVLAIGYAVLLPLRAKGLLPPQMTYTGILLGPAMMFGLIAGLIIIEMRWPERFTLWCSLLYLAIAVLSLTLIYFTRG